MFKALLLISVLLFSGWSWDSGWDSGDIPASSIKTDVSSFDSNLSSDDITVQNALDTIDEMVSSGGSGIPGGSTTQIQYNNAGVFGGVDGFIYNGTEVSYTGNIGIGSTTPSQKLDVAGTVKATGVAINQASATYPLYVKQASPASPAASFNSYSNNYPLLTVNNGSASWPDAGSVAVYGNNSAKIYLYVNQSDGNNSGVIDVLGLSSSSIVALSTRSSSGSGANQGVVSVKDNGTSKIVLDSGGDSYFNVGNLGIGSTGPSQKLDVVGSAKFTGNIGVGSAPSTYGLKVQNDNGIEFYNTAGTSIGSLQREGSSGGYEDQGYLTIKKGGLATAIIGSTIGLFNGFYGGSESVFRVQIAGSSSPYNRQGALALYSAGTQTISLYSAGDSYVNTGGNFGVGSTAPREKLEVDGTIRATGYKSSDGTAGVTVTTCTGFKNGLCISGT